MTFHPAVFNLTVVDPTLYHGFQGAAHPFFQQAQPQPHPHLQNRVPGTLPVPGGVPGGAPGGIPNQYLDEGNEDHQFQSFVHSLPSELQGPIAFRNGTFTREPPSPSSHSSASSTASSSAFAQSRPTVPRLAIPAISNSTFVQLPVSTPEIFCTCFFFSFFLFLIFS